VIDATAKRYEAEQEAANQAKGQPCSMELFREPVKYRPGANAAMFMDTLWANVGGSAPLIKEELARAKGQMDPGVIPDTPKPKSRLSKHGGSDMQPSEVVMRFVCGGDMEAQDARQREEHEAFMSMRPQSRPKSRSTGAASGDPTHVRAWGPTDTACASSRGRRLRDGARSSLSRALLEQGPRAQHGTGAANVIGRSFLQRAREAQGKSKHRDCTSAASNVARDALEEYKEALVPDSKRSRARSITRPHTVQGGTLARWLTHSPASPTKRPGSSVELRPVSRKMPQVNRPVTSSSARVPRKAG